MNDGTTTQSGDPAHNNSTTEGPPTEQIGCSSDENQDNILINTLQRLASKLEVSISSDPHANSHGNTLPDTMDTIPPDVKGSLTLTDDKVLKSPEANHRNVNDACPPLSSHLSQDTPHQEGDIGIRKQSCVSNPDSSLLSIPPGFGLEGGDESIGESRFESCQECDRGISLLEGGTSTLSVATNAGILPMVSFREDEDEITTQCEVETCTPNLAESENIFLEPLTGLDLTTTSGREMNQVNDLIPTSTKPFKTIENVLGGVSFQQKEVILHPPKLFKLAITPPVPPSQAFFQDYNAESYDTPPPSYQETVSTLPAPMYSPDEPTSSLIKKPNPLAIDSPKKESHVSIIRLSNPQMRGQFTRFTNSTSQSALIWHSSGNDLNGDNSDPYSDHQLLALLACIMFWPIGLLAIYYANMASILRSEGIHRKAVEYSKRALGLSLVSFLVGTGVYITFYFKR